MPPANAEQTISVTISASGRLLFGCMNMGFVFSILGGLQALAIVLGLLVTCLLGASTSFTSGSIASIGGFTFYVIVFLVSFWCLMTTGFIYISCAVSLATSALLPKTLFFLMYNAMAAVFYLICTITCLGEASVYSSLKFNSSEVRPMVLAAAVIGIAAGAAYVLIFIVGLFTYRRSATAAST